jgi:hypothetical protein
MYRPLQNEPVHERSPPFFPGPRRPAEAAPAQMMLLNYRAFMALWSFSNLK